MTDVLVSVQRDHITRLMRRTQPVHAIIELIWNGLDAEADNVSVTFDRNSMGGIVAVTVTDDGTGIPASKCESAFKNLGGSWKLGILRTEVKQRPIHGRNGQGRFRAFALGNRVEWISTADDIDGRFESVITADAARPEKFTIRNSGPAQAACGTRVRISGSSTPLTGLDTKKAKARLTREFARHLLRFKGITITYDGFTLNPSEAIERATDYELVPGEGFAAPLPQLQIIEWKSDFPRELILCDAEGFAITDIRPAIHAPQFFFAAYVSWAEFDASNAHLADLGHDRSGPVVEAAREQMRKHFKARAADRLREVVESWKAEKVYPFPDGPVTKLEKAKRDLFDVVAVQALPGISSESRAKRLSLRLIREALEHAPSALKIVLADVLELSNQELDDLANLLDRTSLGSVISSAKLVSERLDFLRSLEVLLFDEELKKDVLERSQLHRMLAAEPWIFGEHFSLGVDDQSIKEVLRRHLRHLGRETLNLADVRLEDRSVQYATEREQFGRAVGSFQAVQHHCANMAIDV
ncbi:ATP-binding protein, partial [Actinomadura sp. NPDC048032]|uniref:ATP-binding protein n=1 Tax=Actinomadura sp. NPDC048032 TaxID=3155747 RepID=UPI003411F398